MSTYGIRGGLACLALLAPPVLAGSGAQDPPPMLGRRPLDPWSLMGKGLYLKGLGLAEDNTARPAPDPMAKDNLAVLRAAVGDYTGAKEAMGEASSPPRNSRLPAESPLDKTQRMDAVTAIVEEGEYRVIAQGEDGKEVGRSECFSD